MRKVQVFEPWHVPALETARRLIPRSRPARVFAGAAAGAVALVLTAVTMWVGTRLDVLAFLLSAGTSQVRAATSALGVSLLASAFGEALVGTLRGTGAVGLAVAVSAFFVTVIAAAFSLRVVATASRRRRA
jgi:hypothetical protein